MLHLACPVNPGARLGARVRVSRVSLQLDGERNLWRRPCYNKMSPTTLPSVPASPPDVCCHSDASARGALFVQSSSRLPFWLGAWTWSLREEKRDSGRQRSLREIRRVTTQSPWLSCCYSAAWLNYWPSRPLSPSKTTAIGVRGLPCSAPSLRAQMSRCDRRQHIKENVSGPLAKESVFSVN
jgi:hypothetical protein